MTGIYPTIKLLHVASVLVSGGLFLSRGLAVQFGARWAMAAPLRYLSYAVDTVLLGAALTLLAVLRLNPFVTPWLGVKLVTLVVYVVAGSLALKRAPTPIARRTAYVVALACFAFMYSVARTHEPLGILGGVLRPG